MDLTPYLETLRADLHSAAAPGGPETVRAADLLGGALESSARLVLLEALSDAAAEITTRLSDASVEVRLRGREADLVVNQTVTDDEVPASAPPTPGAEVLDGGDLIRITLRMPEALKSHVEQLAAEVNVSVNAWLVRAVMAAVNQPAPRPSHPGGRGRPGKRLTGFFEA
jgi:hypothetical protein